MDVIVVLFCEKLPQLVVGNTICINEMNEPVMKQLKNRKTERTVIGLNPYISNISSGAA